MWVVVCWVGVWLGAVVVIGPFGPGLLGNHLSGASPTFPQGRPPGDLHHHTVFTHSNTLPHISESERAIDSEQERERRVRK